MSFRLKSLKTLGLFFVLICFALPNLAQAQFPDIEIKVGDTTGYPNAKNSVISIYMTNRVDTIAGFNLWLQLDRPDIMLFQTDTATISDTTYWKCLSYFGEDCIDSQLVIDPAEANFFHVNTYLDTIGNFDTTGTLTSGWDLIDSRSISGVGTDINIAGIADLPGGNDIPGILPSFTGGLLVKVLADILDIPDTLTDRTVNLLVQTNFKDHFGLSRPNGSSIPWVQEIVPDTACLQCQEWFGDVCSGWIEVTFGTCDSIEVGIDTITVLDTANVKVANGSLTVLDGAVCGNLDGVVEPVLDIDITDLVFFVDWVFRGGPAPEPLWIANLNCDVEDGDIEDLVMMVDFMFRGGAPICVCWELKK